MIRSRIDRIAFRLIVLTLIVGAAYLAVLQGIAVGKRLHSQWVASHDYRKQLDSALAFGNAEAVEKLLGEHPELRPQIQRKGMVLDACIRYHADMVKLFLDYGGNVNEHDQTGTTPLLAAAMRGDVPLLQLLLDRGANVNATNHFGYNAAWYANLDRSPGAVSLLMAHGSKPISRTLTMDEIHAILTREGAPGYK
jgi:hypothetical protein